MKRIVAFGLVALALCSASGCGGKDALMRDLIVHLNQCADMIERNEPKERVMQAVERANGTAEKINKLKLTREQQEELFQRYDDPLKQVVARLKEAQAKRKLEKGDDLPPIVLDDFIKK